MPETEHRFASFTGNPSGAGLMITAYSSWDAMASVARLTSPGARGAHDDPFYANLRWHGAVPKNVRANPALKFVVLVPRPANIFPRAFHEHWLESHSQLVIKHAPALRMKRYVQSHVISSPTIDSFGAGRNWTPNPYSGMTECWWDSEEEMAAGFASKEGQEASAELAEDERKVTNENVIVWASREYEIFNSLLN